MASRFVPVKDISTSRAPTGTTEGMIPEIDGGGGGLCASIEIETDSLSPSTLAWKL